MNKAHFISEDTSGKKTEGDMDALAIQDLKKGVRPEQVLTTPELQKDGNFDLIVKDGEGNLKHIVISNTDPGAKQVHKIFKSATGLKPISIVIGQHTYKLVGMDDGLSAAGTARGPI